MNRASSWGSTLVRSTFRSLRHRNYRLYFLGQFVSLTGTWMQTAALAWLAYQLTGQARWPAFVMAAHMLPACVFGIFGGWLADHFSQRKIIFLAQTGFLAVTILLAILTFAGVIAPWHLIVLMLCQGVAMAADLPARLAFVPSLIPREDLINAVALNSVLFNSARLLGPMVAGLLLIMWGPAVCFAINAVSYAGVLGALWAIRVEEVPRQSSSGRTVTLTALTDGIRALSRDRSLLILVALASSVALIGWPLMSLLPAIAERQLGLAEAAYSKMLSGLGAGALTAALAVAAFGSPARQRWFLFAGVGIIAISLTVLAASRVEWVAVASCVTFGFGMILFFPTGQSMVQLRAENAVRGRVMATWALSISAAVPTGNLIFGPLADRIGVSRVIFIQATLAGLIFLSGIVFVAAGLIRSRTQRRREPIAERSESGLTSVGDQIN